jgi:RNA polymerase sigma-70 factor, ECF subfamily
MKQTNTDDSTDRSLLAAVAATDEHAFTAFYRRFERRVFGYMMSIVGDRTAAEDLVVATMMTVWQSAATFATKSRASTWVLGIARHKAIDYLRSLKRAPATLPIEAAATLEDPAAAAIDMLDNDQRTQSMRVALDFLTTEHQEVLRLAYYEDLPYQEIAELLGIPANTVKSRVFYAKQELLRLLPGTERRRAARY